MLNAPKRMSVAALVLNLISCAALTFGCLPTSLAQTDYGKITIILKEGTERIVIVLVGEQKTTLKCTTNAKGTCVFSAMTAGKYEIRLDNETGPMKGVVSVLPGQSITREISVGGLETVAPGDKTGTKAEGEVDQLMPRGIPGRAGERVTMRQLEELPNRTRSEAPLLEQQPGAVSTITDSFAGFIFNGQSGNQNVLRENGLSSNSLDRSTASFQDTNALIFNVKERQSIKPYKSFSIDTSNTPASFGTGTGGQLLRDVNSGGPKTFSGELYHYFSNDVFGARNFFDFERKPSLRFNLFGFNASGVLIPKKLFVFFNYEGLRANSGNTVFGAAPKLSLQSVADARVAGLLKNFRAAGVNLVDEATQEPNFDILRLETKNFAQRNGVTTRFDYNFRATAKLSFVYQGSRSRENVPDGISGRRTLSLDASNKSVLNIEHAVTEDAKLKNQFIFGAIDSPTRVIARSESNVGPDLFSSVVSIGGRIPVTMAGQSSPLTIPTAGGLLSGDFSGRFLRLHPRQFSLVDQMMFSEERHTLHFGGELRLIQSRLDQLFGTTYTFANLADFLANHATIEHSGDLGSFTNQVGERNVAQEFYIAYLQHEWKLQPGLLMTWGLRYEYYTPLRETNENVVHVDPQTGTRLNASDDLYKSRKANFLPRIAIAWSPKRDDKGLGLAYGSTLLSGSFGMHVGPDVFEHITRPITNDRLTVKVENLSFPIVPAFMIAAHDPENARFKPFALSRDYTSPAQVYKFDFTVKQELIPLKADGRGVLQEAFLTLSYVGSRGRGLLLRNFANRIVSVETNPDSSQGAKIRREFDFIRKDELLQPYSEFEFLTTGGRSSYDSFQASLKGRLKRYLQLFQLNYTLARNRGNSDGDNAIAAGDPFNYDYDYGYNSLDVRHEFKFTTVLSLPCLIPDACKPSREWVVGHLLSNWRLAGIGSFQTGVPIDVRLDRPDVVYVDQAGNVFSAPAAGRSAVLNTRGGGSSVAAYRPNLVAGVNPYLRLDRNLLNPQAFSIPAPGSLGNLQRGALRGPGIRLVDFSFRKEINLSSEGTERILTFNWDISNLFNFTNFRIASAKLPNVLGTDNSNHQLQPNQPFTSEAAPAFGVITRTFKRKSDLGASRQMQFGLSLTF